MADARHTPALNRLAHGWTLVRQPAVPESLVREFIRPAVRAIPSAMAKRLGSCRIELGELENPELSSQWTAGEGRLDVFVAIAGSDPHDVAMELLLCLGEALWERLRDEEARSYWKLLDDEIVSDIPGEIDEQALEFKRSLMSSTENVGLLNLLLRYGRASFASTAAEYVHCLWHDVTVRTGPECLPAPQLRRRLELLAKWFPPDRGYRLFGKQPRD